MAAGQVHCLVTGATGYIGARLVPRLLDEGHRVRALARDPNKLADVPWRESAEVARGDLGELDSLIAAFEGIDVVYYLVHSMGTSKDFGAEETRAVRNVVTAARRTGVRRVVYLSGLHPESSKLSPHLESRKAVGDALIDSGIETMVLQAGVVVGSGSASFEMIRHLTDRLPVMTTPKWVHNSIQPIAVRDALYYLVAAATAACALLAYVGYRRTRRVGVRRHDAGLRGGRGAAPAPLDRAPILDADYCQLVDWDGDPDSARSGAPADRIAGVRRGDAQRRHRHRHRAATGRPDRLPRRRRVGARPRDAGPARCLVGLVALGTGRIAAQRPGLGRQGRLHRRADGVDQCGTRRRLESGPGHRQQQQALERAGARIRHRAAPALKRALTGQGVVGIERSHHKTVAAVPAPRRTIFMPSGIVGRLYWFLLRPLHATALSGLAREVVRSSELVKRRRAGAVRAP